MSEQARREEATRVGLAYAPADEEIADGLDAVSFRAYLRKAHSGPISLGEEWTEFVNCGCGSTRDVTLTVVSLTDGEAVGESTEISYEPAT